MTKYKMDTKSYISPNVLLPLVAVFFMHVVCEIRQTEHTETEKDEVESASPGMAERVNRQ